MNTLDVTLYLGYELNKRYQLKIKEKIKPLYPKSAKIFSARKDDNFTYDSCVHPATCGDNSTFGF